MHKAARIPPTPPTPGTPAALRAHNAGPICAFPIMLCTHPMPMFRQSSADVGPTSTSSVIVGPREFKSSSTSCLTTVNTLRRWKA